MNIKCFTLYDITRTNVSYRKKFADNMSPGERKARNQQSNLETILQIVNMRSQPENISESECIEVKTADLARYDFGYIFSKKYLKQATVKIWSFTFTVEHPEVFNNGRNELGNLLSDCDQVPMIIGLDETVKLSTQLNLTDESRNIYFEMVK